MAVEGEGWFVVGKTNIATGEDSTYFSRNGNFFVDDNYNLVTTGGDLVYGWVDTDASGGIDTRSDNMQFINLDPRNTGAVTNALASATPAISGPNQGDAQIGSITTAGTTISERWRVECVNAQQGWFRVTGNKTPTIGTFPYSSPIIDSRIGTFNIDMGPPSQATMSVPFTSQDGFDEIVHFNVPAGNAQTFNFTAGITGGGVSVTSAGPDSWNVMMPTDAAGNVTSTYEQVVAAINTAVQVSIPTFAASYDATSSVGQPSMALTNQVLNAPAGSVTDLNLGDVAPVGILGWTANEWGGGGNDYTISMVNRGAQQRTTEVVVNGSAISVYLAADSSGAVVATAQDVYDAFQANPEASALVTMTDPAAGGYGAMTVQPFNQLFLSGGSGANLGDYFTFSTTAPGGAQLVSLSVNREGGIIGTFDNGSTEELARVALAKIPNPEGLIAMGQGKFATSPVSGAESIVMAGTGGTGGIASGFLEMSNVDLTREFTNMIVNQRGFQANSRIITTSDEMLQELMQLKR
jgi:flagellar hook protein FlgE